MKVLFLDVDGVLVHSESIRLAHSVDRTRMQRKFSEIDPVCAERLKRIVDATGCTLVLSSIWRTTPEYIHALNQALREVGFPRRVVQERTPFIASQRHLEVSAWLREHPEVTTYICLDDGVIEGHPTVLVANGHFTGGLQNTHVDEAIRMLKGG